MASPGKRDAIEVTGSGIGALGGTGQTLGGTADRLEVAMVEITFFDAVGEAHPIAEPVETIGQDDLALGAERDPVDFDRGAHFVAGLQVDLALVRSGKCVWFPRGCHDCQGYTFRPVKSTIETLEGNKVKLTIEIDEVEFDRNIDDAFRKIAKEIRVPGFRQGKAPRKVLEAQIGRDAARGQAIQDAIPEYLTLAVREHDVDLIATPAIDITKGEKEGAVAFDATCEVRPEITVAGYDSLRVELPTLVVEESEVDEALETERRRHGSLRDVERAVQKGDTVSVDLAGTRDGNPVPGLNVNDWSYEVGKAWVSPKFDDQLIGASIGSTIEFSDAPNGTEEVSDFVVTVKKVQEMVLEDLTDEWVKSTIGEFDTVDAWRASLRERIETMKLGQCRSVFVERTTAALSELVTIDAPDAMVQSDLQGRVRATMEQFQAQGISFDQWLSVTGQSAEVFVEMMRGESTKAVKVDLALRAVATARDIVVEDADIDKEIDRIAMQVNRKAAEVRKAYEKQDMMVDLVAQIRKSKAVDWLLRNSTLVDDKGNAIAADTLFGESDADSAQ